MKLWIVLSVLTALTISPLEAQSYSDAPYDSTLEAARAASSQLASSPEIDEVEVSGATLWALGQTTPAMLSPGAWVTLNGKGFGAGPDVDYAKIMVGKCRAVERDVRMYRGVVDLLQRYFYESTTQFDEWPSDIQSWTDRQIVFRVPVEASGGPLVVQVQKRTGANASLFDPSRPHSIWDPMTDRVDGMTNRAYDVISTLGFPARSNPVPLQVDNPVFQSMVSAGEAIFWTYDFNVGLVHHLNKMDWPGVFSRARTNPVTGQAADPGLFGAIPIAADEVPSVVTQGYTFDPYPAPNPIKPLLRSQLDSGHTSPTGWVGYVYAESINPFTQLKGNWIGFSCASCHSRRISYEAAPGETVATVFPGLPNPQWSMKWNVLGGMKGIVGNETGPDGTVAPVDKTNLVYAVPPGTGEASLVRSSDDKSPYANDYLFSPIAIPIITRHTPVRRALSRPEMIVGFEGSYAHAEEPDGGLGALLAPSLQELTAYMTTLDRNDEILRRLGLYRWLSGTGRLAEVGNSGEGSFMQAGPAAFPQLVSHLKNGKQIFARECLSCHQTNFGTFTDENMIPLTTVGSYFSPTIFQLETQSIRTAILRDLYWVESRGLLHDGHVKSMEDLVDPARCEAGSSLYNQYYTIHPGSFHIPKGTPAQELALRRTAYFVDESWDPTSLYWDFQGMRGHFGPRELGTASGTSLPATPHPWCASSASEVEDLVHYLMTL